MTTSAEKGDVMDGEGDGVTIIGEVNLSDGGDAVMLGPFGDTGADVHANHCPIIDDGGKAEWCQCVLLLVEVMDHGNSDGLL